MDKTQHLSMDDLLALRDGEGSASSRSHVDACDECRCELERLYQIQARLRAMPTFSPPRDIWRRIARSVGRRRLRRRLSYGAIGLAAAAALTAVVVLRGSSTMGSEQSPDAWIAEATSPDMGPSIRRSRQLESILQANRPGQRVYDAPTALAVSVLEDRIVLLDQMLSEVRIGGADRAVMVGLWDERVATLEKLVGLQAVQEDRVWR